MSRDHRRDTGRDEMHQTLCAYVLGELGEQERERVDAALARSEDLRAQREQIEATIGLVRGAYADPAGLAPQVVSAIEEGATAAPAGPFVTRGWRAAAALLVLLTGAGLAWRALGGAVGDKADEERLARGTAGTSLSSSASPVDRDALLLDSSEGHAARGSGAPRPSTAKPASAPPQGVPAAEEGTDGRPAPLASNGGTYRGPSDGIPAGTSGSTVAAGDQSAPVREGAAGGASAVAGLPGEPAAPEATRRSLMSLNGPDTRGRTERFYAYPPAPSGGGGGGGPVRDDLYKDEAGKRAAGADEFFLGGLSRNSSATTPVPGNLGVPARATETGASGPATPGPSGGASSPPVTGGGDRLRAPVVDRGRESLGEPLAREGDRNGFAARARSLGREHDRLESLLASCRRRPGERPGAMFFRFWGDNPFELTALDAQSTFGVDVDTASYALARRMLNEGYLPPREQVRTEEFLNYFEPDVAAPTEGVFSIRTDLAASRFGVGIAPRSGRVEEPHQLRVVIRGREVSGLERKPLALTFVVDTSGSMKKNRRLELVKHALRQLVGQLDGRDAIALVAFSNEARLVLPMTTAASRGVIESAIFGLNPDGGTNADAGIRLGYELAVNELTLEANNRVVFLSDGVANIGETDQERIAEAVKVHREKGIYLNTVGVGLENHNDVFLEQLANRGDGICNYVDSPEEVQRALVDNFTGAFEPIARDVKVQVEFDPRFVHRWRLLGYENRAIADADFRNDAVDAGEIGAGHQVVALYELDLNSIPDEEDPPLATVRLRWKRPTGPGRDPLEDGATEVEQRVHWGGRTTFEGASAGFRRSVCVAQFAEILRRSIHARNDSLGELISVAATLERELADPEHIEFLSLMVRTRDLIRQTPYPAPGDLERCLDTLRRNHILDCEYAELSANVDDSVVAELERQNRELEERIRELIRQESEGR